MRPEVRRFLAAVKTAPGARSTLPPLTRRQRNRRALKMLFAVLVVGGFVQAALEPKPLKTMPVDPVTAAEDAQREKQLHDCQVGHAMLEVSGAARSMGPLERYHWCEVYGGG